MNPSGNHEERHDNNVPDDEQDERPDTSDALELFLSAGLHHATNRGVVRPEREDWCDPDPAAALRLPHSAHPIARVLTRHSPHRQTDVYYMLRRACERLQGRPLKSLTTEDVFAFPWHHLTPSDVAEYRQDIYKRFTTQSTRNDCVVAVRSVVYACARARLISPLRRDLLLEELPTSKPQRSRTGRALREDEIAALLRQCATTGSAASRARDTAIIALMYSSGARVGEVTKLNLQDWNRDTNTLTLLRTKNGRDHTVFLHPRVVPLLEEWVAVRGHLPGALFCSFRAFGYEHMSRGAIRLMMQAHADKAGVAHFTPHDLRRTFASFMLRTHDHALVSRLLNHEKLESTLVYDMAGDDLQRDAIASFNLPTANSDDEDPETEVPL